MPSYTLRVIEIKIDVESLVIASLLRKEFKEKQVGVLVVAVDQGKK